MPPHVAHLLIGRPTNHAPDGEAPWITAIFRTPVSTPVFLTTTGFEGDEVAEKDVHGGPEKAALCYSLSNYPLWRAEHILDSSPGGFGENLAIDGQDESTVCIGDCYRIGEAEVQISQPRGPCSTLARRWNLPSLIKLVLQNHRSGWYIRVLREGNIAPNDSIELLSRPNPTWTISRAAEVNYSPQRTQQDLRELISLPELSVNWKYDLQLKLQASHSS
ncbi:MAG TPA: MOSC domain-containing protein [Candidatus Koribacter sp.]|jgi:MOSC domain-containing protein YiiM